MPITYKLSTKVFISLTLVRLLAQIASLHPYNQWYSTLSLCNSIPPYLGTESLMSTTLHLENLAYKTQSKASLLEENNLRGIQIITSS